MAMTIKINGPNVRASAIAIFAMLAGSSAVLTNLSSFVHAAQSGNPAQVASSESTSSSQPIWSYQVKPTNYLGAQIGGNGQTVNSPYTSTGAMPSLFDAFNGLSQRQGALTTSPFLSILPIILIAAGGLLLLLPMFTMMMANPFGGGFGGGGFQGPFGYPQVSTLSKRRSLDGNQRSILELIEHFSATIEDLTRKHSPGQAQSQQQASQHDHGASQQFKRTAKALNDSPAAPPTPTNHKPAAASEESLNGLLVGGSLSSAS